VVAAKAAGAVTLNFGLFVNTIINFVILAFVIFLMVKGVNNLRRPKPAPAAAPTTKDCPFCISAIPIKATRCPNCTSELRA
jgi:large conductance mechanosensitive channel